MNTSRNRFVLALVLGTCFCLAALLMGSPLAAQSTFGSISGTVSDASGSSVPDVVVTLTNVATTAKQTITTGGDGSYTFVNVLPASTCSKLTRPASSTSNEKP